MFGRKFGAFLFSLVFIGALLAGTAIWARAGDPIVDTGTDHYVARRIQSSRNIMLVDTQDYCALNWYPATRENRGAWVVYKVGQGADKTFLHEGNDFYNALAAFDKCE